MGQTTLFSNTVGLLARRRLDGPALDSVGFDVLLDAFDSLEDAVAVTRLTTQSESLVLMYANRAFFSLAEAMSIRTDSDDAPTVPMPIPCPSENPLWSNLLESHRSDDVFTAAMIFNAQAGSRTIWELRSTPLRDESGHINGDRVAVVRDITRQTMIEDTLRRNERLACVGLLAAGIAHEINNPTGSALLAAETALAMMDSPHQPEQVAACLKNIVTSMDRCGRIVRTLLRYTREESSDKQACNINDVAEQVAELARPYVERHQAALRLDLDPEMPLAPMNPLEIELVLINLVRNAVESGEDRVAVSLRTLPIDGGVRVEVTDNGCGMSREQLARVFDPLYTTRRKCGGSGLGMSIAYGIVQGHHGTMTVRSEPGVGTTVTIDLPAAGDPASLEMQTDENKSFLPENATGERRDHGPNPDR